MSISPPKGLSPFIAELQTLNVQQHNDATNIKNVSEILKVWVRRKDWLEEKYFQVDERIGFNSWLLHEESDHSLAVNLVAWQPGREIIPHDHKTWGVVGSVIGTEKNYFWRRLDKGSKPGYAEIQRQDAVTICEPGDIISFLPDDIHSVINETESIAVSLHVYGKNLNYVNRFQYDPLNKTVKPLIIGFS